MLHRFRLGGAPARLDADAVALAPAQHRKGLPERGPVDPESQVVLRCRHQGANTPHPPGLLRAYSERPSCGTADESDERTPPHWQTLPGAILKVSGTQT